MDSYQRVLKSTLITNSCAPSLNFLICVKVIASDLLSFAISDIVFIYINMFIITFICIGEEELEKKENELKMSSTARVKLLQEKLDYLQKKENICKAREDSVTMEPI